MFCTDVWLKGPQGQKEQRASQWPISYKAKSASGKYTLVLQQEG
jgi:hypothetical protein